MQGFFSPTEIAGKAPPSLVPRCGACGLYRACNSPKLPVAGRGRRGVLVVADAPEAADDATGKLFSGRNGRHLRAALGRAGLDPDEDCWLTYALICRTAKGAAPDDRQVEHCRPNLTGALARLKPAAVILAGDAAVRSLIGVAWREDVGPLHRWVGHKIPSRRFNAYLCPTYDPATALYHRDEKRFDLYDRHFCGHVKEAAELADAGRPYPDGVPDLRASIRRIIDAGEACDAVDAFVERGGPVAVDYETNCKKPDTDAARALCFSVSDGRDTVAYPWTRSTAEATRRLLRSGLPKIASNLKFEERWSMALLGCRVKNWAFDTMLAAHCLDNRTGVTSIKFQSFVLLGQESYDDAIEPLRTSRGGGYSLNRLREAGLDDLLLYCGMDSLLEFKVARIQAAKIGVDL
jgi:uracil-DNA glycosylase family 4